jgi:uncharacterized protein
VTQVDGGRPFGAHIRMSWWKALLAILVPPVVLVVLQVALYLLVGVVEGSDDPLSPEITPLRFLAVNVSVGAAGVLAIVLMTRLAGVPWRSLISAPRRFDPRRLVRYLVASAILVGCGFGVVALVAPDAPGWTRFGVSATTVAVVVIALLTTPLQAAGEELMYRSVALPAAASWIRAGRPALAVGLVVSSLSFAVSHGSTDPWLFGYFFGIAVLTGLMAVISDGIEAPVAFHVANNVIATVINTAMADGAAFPLDRTSDTGNAALLIPAAFNVVIVVVVWLQERRRRRR